MTSPESSDPPRLPGSTSTLEPAECRVCFEGEEAGPLISPCACSGTYRYVHYHCLEPWCVERGSTMCEICKKPYDQAGASLLDDLNAAVRASHLLPGRRRPGNGGIGSLEGEDLQWHATNMGSAHGVRPVLTRLGFVVAILPDRPGGAPPRVIVMNPATPDNRERDLLVDARARAYRNIRWCVAIVIFLGVALTTTSFFLENRSVQLIMRIMGIILIIIGFLRLLQYVHVRRFIQRREQRDRRIALHVETIDPADTEMMAVVQSMRGRERDMLRLWSGLPRRPGPRIDLEAGSGGGGGGGGGGNRIGRESGAGTSQGRSEGSGP